MPESSPKPRAVAYLVSQYPMLSMIFIIREVLQLRRLGWRIDVASINAADRAGDGLTADEAAEADATYYLKPHGLRGALAAHVDTLRRTPRGWLRGMLAAVQLAGADLRALALNLAYFSEALMVGVWMRERGQCHLHAHLGSQAATVALFVKRVFGHGFSVTVHGPDEFYDAYRQYLPQKVAEADFICCISHYARSQLMRLAPYAHWHKLEVARLGVDPAHFAPRPRPQPEDGVFELLCVGRLTPSKGQHLLIDALARLRGQGRRVRLRVVGAGPDRASLEEQVRHHALSEAVIFEGAVNQDRIRALYARADCFCIASFAEGIPVVLMEAMAMAVPCVTTRITGIPELIEDGRDGLLVAPSDVEGLAAAIERLIDDPALYERLACAGRRRVVEDYDLARNVDRLGEIFARRIAGAPARHGEPA